MSYLGDRLTTPFHWTFETYDPTPPTVTETTPLADAIDVEPGTAVQVIFDRPLLVGGEGASFALEGPAGPVASTLRWIPADERPDPLLQGRGMNTAGRSQAFVGLELRPLRPLQASTLYTATVKGVQNASGLPMAGEHSWQFRTKNGAVVQNVMPVETSYYTFGSQRVALRISGDPDPERNGLFYIHTDHLGSTSLLSYGQGHAQAGEEVPGSRAAHLPFGEHRVEPEAGLSDRGFTGHRELGGTGLVHMRARLYSAELNRFLSADTIVPDREDPQSFNRYAYARNNPVKYVDPDGHCWGFASGIRNWNYTVGGKTYGGGVNCANIDMALAIVQHPDATPEQKALAGTYLGGWGVAAVSGAAGIGLLTCSSIPACAAAAKAALGIGTAACRDGDCTNEVVSLANATQNGLNAVTNGLGQGFRSFSSFKYNMGSAGEGMAWHHIVGQHASNVARFGEEAIHNADNLIRLPSGAGEIHMQVSGYYNSIDAVLTGSSTMRVFEWLSMQSFEFQWQFGVDTIIRFGGAEYILQQFGG